MNPITLSVLVLCTAFAVKKANSADLPVQYNHVEYKQSGNSYTWKPLTGKTPGGEGVVFRGATGISDASPKISTLARLPFDKRTNVPAADLAKATSSFTKAAAGKAILRGALGLTGVGMILPAAYEIYKFLNSEHELSNIRNENGQIVADKIKEGSGYEFKWSDKPWGSLESACSAALAFYKASGSGFIYSSDGYLYNAQGVVTHCKIRQAHPTNGSVINNIQTVANRKTSSASVDTINQQQIEDMIAQNSGWPTAAARALQQALNVPGNTIETGTPTVTGPASIPGTTTTTTTQTQVAPGTTTPVAPGTPGAEPATQKTTTTTTNNATYNNNNVTHNTKTITTTNITNNITNQTETKTDKEETKEEENKEDESPPTDTDLTKVPELYERKYPDGMVGIWESKSEEIKQSPLFTLAEDLMPTGISGGSCPSWSLDLSFGGSFGDYGSQDVSPPCWIWDVARLIIIASALILARALVFGG